MTEGDIYDQLKVINYCLQPIGVAALIGSAAYVGGALADVCTDAVKRRLGTRSLQSYTVNARVLGAAVCAGTASYMFGLMPPNYPLSASVEGIAGIVGAFVIGGGPGAVAGAGIGGVRNYVNSRRAGTPSQIVKHAKRGAVIGGACLGAIVAATYVSIRSQPHPFDFSHWW